MNVSVVGDGLLRQKVFYARELQDKIEAIDQVLTTELSGAPEELLEATVNKSKLESYNISLRELYSAISNNNLIIPGGSQDTGDGRLSLIHI